MRPRIRDRGSGTEYAVCGARQSCRSRPSTRRAVARKWGTGAIVPGVRAKSAPERLVLAVRMRLEAKRAAVPQVTTSRGSKTYVRRVESERTVTSCPTRGADVTRLGRLNEFEGGTFAAVRLTPATCTGVPCTGSGLSLRHALAAASLPGRLAPDVRGCYRQLV